ncbi:MAG TPA: glutamate-5-semialdehyde dehydrogenase [Candidatus Pelagibacter sp.]|jgi:glutamate-5-semialdehyde dehydrogenase|nr:glutamate-5-semialdehyde dehydrogenase [Candidatus Pelagibacter sp.]
MINYLNSLGKKSQVAFKNMIDNKTKNKVLDKFVFLIEKEKKLITKENNKDINLAIKRKLKENLIDRLLLNSVKLKGIQSAIRNISKLKDPIDVTLHKWRRPNGLIIKKISIPIGVIGIIYESRPNVTSDASSLCFKSGNAVILRGGSEAFNTNKILANLFRTALKENKVDPNYVQFINKRDRKIVDFMLSKMGKYIDVIIPRGGKTLVKKVQEFSSVPIIGHLEGICHTYIDKDADLNMATKVVHNAKLRNTSICGATETVLMHKKIVKKFCNPILNNLEKNNCKIYADKTIRRHYKGKSNLAKEKDWSTEYLSAKISVKSVSNLDQAISHVNKYGTMHTDCIITKNKKNAGIFLKKINSSIAIHNASTQFADGGEFGFGGEVGISTNKLPPRGPVGLNQLISYKYEVLGKGQIRK